MVEKVIDIIKNGNISIPRLLITKYKKLNITEKELVILIYLLNETNVFNPKKISSELELEIMEVLEIISNLTNKDILKIEVVKVGGIREEHINFESLYNKLAFFIVNEEVKVSEKTNLFDLFEKEFGRTLSPIEYEIIKGWSESDFSDEIIICALKEAVYNGVFRLNYIDKILFEWKKKGIKTKEDVEKNNKNFHKNKKELKEEVFEYDWLNESE